MTVIPAPPSPTHDLGPTRFTSLATPSRGSTRTSLWLVEIDPGTPPTPHSMSHEEVFVVLDGSAAVRLAGGELETAGPGDAVVVPPDVRFEISTAGTEGLRMMCCTSVGARATTDDGAEFTPPWSR
jgi:quercetin dioxygenase-like cupin family protein